MEIAARTEGEKDMLVGEGLFWPDDETTVARNSRVSEVGQKNTQIEMEPDYSSHGLDART